MAANDHTKPFKLEHLPGLEPAPSNLATTIPSIRHVTSLDSNKTYLYYLTFIRPSSLKRYIRSFYKALTLNTKTYEGIYPYKSYNKR